MLPFSTFTTSKNILRFKGLWLKKYHLCSYMHRCSGNFVKWNYTCIFADVEFSMRSSLARSLHTPLCQVKGLEISAMEVCSNAFSLLNF